MPKGRLKRLARQEARLRYNPERRGLIGALGEAKATRRSEKRAARSTGRGLRATIRASRKPTEENYDRLDSALAKSDGTFDGGVMHADLQGLGGAAGSIVAAALAESASARQRASEARSNRMQDLDDQIIRAREGQVGAVRQANQAYRQNTAKILQQLAALDADEGLYSATALGRMRNERSGRRTNVRTQREARDARFMEKYGVTYEQFKSMTPKERRNAERAHNPDKSKDGKGKKPREWAPPATQGKAADTISLALAQAKRLKREKLDRAGAAQVLTEGREKIKGEKDGTEFEIPEVPKFAGLWASIALDLAYDGHISARNARLLRKRGIRVRKLGYKFSKSYQQRIKDNEVAGPPRPR